MQVYWLEQRQADVPATNDWLGAQEASLLSALRFPKRRADWRLGRWTAKCALAGVLRQPDVAAIEVIADGAGVPRTFVSGIPASTAISLSHRADVGACAVTVAPGAIGCDLELVEERSRQFLEDFFTIEESRLINRHCGESQALLAATLWSAKESALKAIGEGLRVDTRSVYVTDIDLASGADWSPLEVCSETGEVYAGWWRESDGMVRTLVTSPACAAPIRIDATC